jgi:hypothetical protein
MQCRVNHRRQRFDSIYVYANHALTPYGRLEIHRDFNLYHEYMLMKMLSPTTPPGMAWHAQCYEKPNTSIRLNATFLGLYLLLCEVFA